MAITATNNGAPRELIPAGNYIARCYQMIHIGTIEELIMGEKKTLNKVRIGWELPMETRVFNPERGEQPCIISQEFTLSMNEKANLRKMLASWRGKDFTEEEAKAFDITRLLGVPCFLNIIHKPSKDGTKMYENIAGVTPVPKGFDCPPQVNPLSVWDYDNPNMEILNNLPDFVKNKVMASQEYQKLMHPETTNIPQENGTTENANDLPF